MPIIIDNPADLSKEQLIKLSIFFESQLDRGIRVWEKNTPYGAGQDKFIFSHKVVQRNRKDPNKPGHRVEFVSNTMLGEGTFGCVYEITGTLAINPDDVIFKCNGYKTDYHKTRVIKIQEHQNRYNPIKKAIEEYQLSKKASHLAVKEPTIRDKTSYTVMNKQEGEELIGIIIKDRDNKKKLTLEQRVNLTIALLNALKTQVTDIGLIHRDIKGENILVDLNKNPIKVNIIDYAFSTEIGTTDRTVLGTPGYVAPEIYLQKEHTTKIDVYSLARVIALIWDIDSVSYVYQYAYEFENNAAFVNLDSLFCNIKGLDLNNKNIIKTTLEAMLRADSNQRISIDEAIQRMEKIELKIQPIPPLPPSTSTQTRLIPSPNPVVSIEIEPEPLVNTTQKKNIDYANRSKTLHQAPLNLKDVEKSRKNLDAVLNKIALLRTKGDNLYDRNYLDLGNKLYALAINLTDNLNTLKNMPDNEYADNVGPTIKECHKLLEKEAPHFAKHRNINYILANIGLALGGGLFYAAACLYNRNFFFTQTKSSQLLDKVDNAFDTIIKV